VQGCRARDNNKKKYRRDVKYGKSYFVGEPSEKVELKEHSEEGAYY
jgi:hypothetical protein